MPLRNTMARRSRRSRASAVGHSVAERRWVRTTSRQSPARRYCGEEMNRRLICVITALVVGGFAGYGCDNPSNSGPDLGVPGDAAMQSDIAVQGDLSAA